MEFSENGAVVSNTPQATNSYKRPTSDKGYKEGPRSLLGLYQAMRIGLIAYVSVEVLFLMLLTPYFIAPNILPDFMFAETSTNINYVSVAELICTLVEMVAFFFACRFVYRAMRNLHTVQSPAAEVSPGWAVGYYFVPIANFFMPANAMSQIYHGTYEAVGEKSRHESPIPLWWTFSLIAGIPTAISNSAEFSGYSALAMYTLSAAMGIIAAIALIRMGVRIAVRQEQLKHGGIAQVFE